MTTTIRVTVQVETRPCASCGADVLHAALRAGTPRVTTSALVLEPDVDAHGPFTLTVEASRFGDPLSTQVDPFHTDSGVIVATTNHTAKDGWWPHNCTVGTAIDRQAPERAR